MEVLNRMTRRGVYASGTSRGKKRLQGVASMEAHAPVRKEYCRPEIEDLGSLHELTAAGGPKFGTDSAYVPGNPATPFGVS
jgi:hypothetical protein